MCKSAFILSFELIFCALAPGTMIHIMDRSQDRTKLKMQDVYCHEVIGADH